MPEKVRLFIDFWNLQLAWNEHAGGARLNWPKLPQVLLAQAQVLSGLDTFQYDGTSVYASVDVTKAADRNLRNWLDNFLDRQAGITVFVRERRPRTRTIHCQECNQEFSACPHCGKPLRKAAEKGVDAAIVTDMMSLAWEGACTIPILISSDADFIPTVERLQAKGMKVVNAAWRKEGHDLAKTCWVSIILDDLVEELTR